MTISRVKVELLEDCCKIIWNLQSHFFFIYLEFNQNFATLICKKWPSFRYISSVRLNLKKICYKKCECLLSTRCNIFSQCPPPSMPLPVWTIPSVPLFIMLVTFLPVALWFLTFQSYYAPSNDAPILLYPLPIMPPSHYAPCYILPFLYALFSLYHI